MRLIAVLIAAATATAAFGTMTTTSEARDGCGQGMYWNGRGCAPMRYERGPEFFRPGYQGGYGYDDGYRRGGYDRRGYDRGGPPSERRNGGGCPRNYTVQDGQCKPYTGR